MSAAPATLAVGPAVAICRAAPPSEILSQLAAVEAACFDRPWGAAGLGEALGQSGAAVAYLDEPRGAVSAYCLYQRVLDEVEILQLGTAPQSRGRGLGRRLVAAVRGDAAQAGATAIFLEVRRGNAAALAVYQGAGFAVCGVRRGYYPPLPGATSVEDALLLRCDLPFAGKSR